MYHDLSHRPPKTNIARLKIGHPKRKFHLPTIYFSGVDLLLVWGRVALKNRFPTIFPWEQSNLSPNVLKMSFTDPVFGDLDQQHPLA